MMIFNRLCTISHDALILRRNSELEEEGWSNVLELFPEEVPDTQHSSARSFNYQVLLAEHNRPKHVPQKIKHMSSFKP
jgi:hypothetical protein